MPCGLGVLPNCGAFRSPCSPVPCSLHQVLFRHGTRVLALAVLFGPSWAAVDGPHLVAAIFYFIPLCERLGLTSLLADQEAS